MTLQEKIGNNWIRKLSSTVEGILGHWQICEHYMDNCCQNTLLPSLASPAMKGWRMWGEGNIKAGSDGHGLVDRQVLL